MSFDKQAKDVELLKIEFSKEHAQFLLDMTPNRFTLFYFYVPYIWPKSETWGQLIG